MTGFNLYYHNSNLFNDGKTNWKDLTKEDVLTLVAKAFEDAAYDYELLFGYQVADKPVKKEADQLQAVASSPVLEQQPEKVIVGGLLALMMNERNYNNKSIQTKAGFLRSENLRNLFEQNVFNKKKTLNEQTIGLMSLLEGFLKEMDVYIKENNVDVSELVVKAKENNDRIQNEINEANANKPEGYEATIQALEKQKVAIPRKDLLKLTIVQSKEAIEEYTKKGLRPQIAYMIEYFVDAMPIFDDYVTIFEPETGLMSLYADLLIKVGKLQLAEINNLQAATQEFNAARDKVMSAFAKLKTDVRTIMNPCIQVSSPKQYNDKDHNPQAYAAQALALEKSILKWKDELTVFKKAMTVQDSDKNLVKVTRLEQVGQEMKFVPEWLSSAYQNTQLQYNKVKDLQVNTSALHAAAIDLDQVGRTPSRFSLPKIHVATVLKPRNILKKKESIDKDEDEEATSKHSASSSSSSSTSSKASAFGSNMMNRLLGKKADKIDSPTDTKYNVKDFEQGDEPDDDQDVIEFDQAANNNSNNNNSSSNSNNRTVLKPAAVYNVNSNNNMNKSTMQPQVPMVSNAPLDLNTQMQIMQQTVMQQMQMMQMMQQQIMQQQQSAMTNNNNANVNSSSNGNQLFTWKNKQAGLQDKPMFAAAASSSSTVNNKGADDLIDFHSEDEQEDIDNDKSSNHSNSSNKKK
jgi:uncharacterized protein YdcH (DUF465 family)